MGKKSMEDVWNEVRRVHGDEGLFIGDEDVGKCDVVSTGSYAIDEALGIYGIPRCHLSQFSGFQASGKTLLALSTIAQGQKQDPNAWAVFVDCEYTYDATWARQLGVDTSRVLVLKENRGIQVFERLCGQAGKTLNKKAKYGILDMEIEDHTGLFMICVDSVAAIQPPMEETSEIGKANIALLPRFLNPELRRITPMISKANVALVFINQLRDKPGTMAWGDPTIAVGGHCLHHACSLCLNFNKIGGADSKIERNDEQVGHHVRARVEKNKKSSSYRVAEFAVEYTRGVIGQNEELKELGCKYGVIERPNNRTYVYDGVTYNGKESMADALKEEIVQKAIWEKIKVAREEMLVNGAPTVEPVIDSEE